MPTIYKPPKKERKPEKRVYKSESKRDNLNHSAVYNTTIWRSLRLEYLNANPLCEICAAKGLIKSASEVHHKTPISKGKTKHEKEFLGFDWENLQTVCKSCHKSQHTKTIIL
jgi:5-methylcytosine-specific restriction endonuclease McrA